MHSLSSSSHETARLARLMRLGGEWAVMQCPVPQEPGGVKILQPTGQVYVTFMDRERYLG
jgi:hypothetical protein